MARRTRRISTKNPTRKSVVTGPRNVAKIGRNEPCPCASGKKYKDCHYADGQPFLQQLAMEEDQQRIRDKRQRLKEDGIPWYRRIFVR